jgi:hypothetical protein
MTADATGRCRAVGCDEPLSAQLVDSPDGTGVHLSEWCMARLPLGRLDVAGAAPVVSQADLVAAIATALPGTNVIPFQFSAPAQLPPVVFSAPVQPPPELCCGGWVGPAGREVCARCPAQCGACQGLHFCVKCGAERQHGEDDWCDTHRPAAEQRYAQPAAADVPTATADEPLGLKVVVTPAGSTPDIATVPAAPVLKPPTQVVKGSVLSTDQARLRAELIGVVREYAAEDPRSLQVAIGPSEIGDPCDARIARTVLGLPKVNDSDPWASFVGQATHAKLADAFGWANDIGEATTGDRRYLIEQRVYLTDGISGSCDLYEAGDVIDHKVVGTDTMKAHLAHGWAANPKYGTQLDLYGLGWHNAGQPVERVSLALWPRSGFLDGLLVLTRPWDQGNAERAMERLSAITERAVRDKMDDEDAPWEDMPTAPGKGCGFCPFHAPNQPKTRFTCPDGRQFQAEQRRGKGPRGSAP